MKTFEITTLVIAAALVVACGREAASTDGAKGPNPRPDGSAPAHGSAEVVGTPPAPSNGLSGKVLETMDSGGYTYLRLETSQGEIWAAVGQAKVQVGQGVEIVGAMAMNGFESRTLKRKFDLIYFGTLATGAAAPLTQGQEMAKAHGDVAAATGPAVAAGIPRAAGADGHTVAEVVSQAKTLAGKTVTVRGQVVKYSAMILGKNWVHIRDGSGSAAHGDHDLTITTQDTMAIGDIVQLRGTVALDKDFGAGYVYAVMLEDGHIVP